MTDPRPRQLLAQLERLAPFMRERGRGQELEQLQDLAANADEAFERTHFSPGHFTASGFVLSPDQGSLLLIHHRKLGLWLQPGGHIEAGDVDYLAACTRELHEETGLTDLELLNELIDVDIHQIPALSGEPTHLHFDLRALFASKTTSVYAGDGVKKAHWFSLADIVSHSGGILMDGVGTDASVIRVARAALLLQRVTRYDLDV